MLKFAIVLYLIRSKANTTDIAVHIFNMLEESEKFPEITCMEVKSSANDGRIILKYLEFYLMIILDYCSMWKKTKSETTFLLENPNCNRTISFTDVN